MAEVPREQFPCSILAANVMRMSLTCHEEIGVPDVSDEDATRLLQGNCAREIYAYSVLSAI